MADDLRLDSESEGWSGRRGSNPVQRPEYGGADGRVEFRRDIESLVSLEVLEQIIVPGRGDLPPSGGAFAFFDGAGGTTRGGDSVTLAIGHREGTRRVIDLLREGVS
jgi:hypothetical protein